MSIFKGSGTALVTPFKDGRVDYNALEKLIEWQIASETDAIISCGTTGEASTLSTVERLSVIEFTVKSRRPHTCHRRSGNQRYFSVYVPGKGNRIFRCGRTSDCYTLLQQDDTTGSHQTLHNDCRLYGPSDYSLFGQKPYRSQYRTGNST